MCPTVTSTSSSLLQRTPGFVSETASEAETLDLARRLGALLRPGDWIGLVGELGSGKTVFVRGLAEAFNCQEPARSPTFVLFQTYRSKSAGRCPLRHVDLYRLKPAEVPSLEWDLLLDAEGVTVVEWAEKAAPLWPPDCLVLEFAHLGADRRRLKFFAAAGRGLEIVQKLKRPGGR
jgi:tRNA threonylcarbamoyladenosine biosynthesis protein TsaE